MSNLLAPNKTFDELIQLLKEHYNPIPSEIAQRFKFNSRVQMADETIAEFMGQLRGLSTH